MSCYTEVIVHPEWNLIFYVGLGVERAVIAYNMDNRKVHVIPTHYIPYGRRTTAKPSISDIKRWRNFILSLIPIIFVAKLILITVMPIISDKILLRHKKHLLWQIE